MRNNKKETTTAAATAGQNTVEISQADYDLLQRYKEQLAEIVSWYPPGELIKELGDVSYRYTMHVLSSPKVTSEPDPEAHKPRHLLVDDLYLLRQITTFFLKIGVPTT